MASAANVSVQIRSDLREMSFGSGEGKRWSEMKEMLGVKTLEASPDVCVLGGETYADFRIRVVRALREITVGSDGGSTVVITHMGVIWVALTELASIPRSRDRGLIIDPCSVYRFVSLGSDLTFIGQVVSRERIEESGVSL